MIHIAVVSPVQAVRTGLRVMLDDRSLELLQGLQTDPERVISEAASLDELGDWLSEVDVLVLPVSETVLDSLQEVAGQLEGRLAVLLLADHPQAIQSLAGLSLRAWGILPLECTAEELNAAVYALHEGLLVLSPLLAGPVLERDLAIKNSHLASGPLAGEVIETLTPREIEVLDLLAQGLPNKQIARQLVISEHTVKFHVSSIYTKLGVTNRTEAVRAGVQQGLIVM